MKHYKSYTRQELRIHYTLHKCERLLLICFALVGLICAGYVAIDIHTKTSEALWVTIAESDNTGELVYLPERKPTSHRLTPRSYSSEW